MLTSEEMLKMCTVSPVTSEQVRHKREAHACGLHEAKRMCQVDNIEDAINLLDETVLTKSILKAMFDVLLDYNK